MPLLMLRMGAYGGGQEVDIADVDIDSIPDPSVSFLLKQSSIMRCFSFSNFSALLISRA